MMPYKPISYKPAGATVTLRSKYKPLISGNKNYNCKLLHYVMVEVYQAIKIKLPIDGKMLPNGCSDFGPTKVNKTLEIRNARHILVLRSQSKAKRLNTQHFSIYG